MKEFEFGTLKNVDLRTIWKHEALFTTWLSENINALGDALGMELELEEQEAKVGDFSLDLLAKDLNSDKQVVIENQLEKTDHDHLGKLLTYASGFDASTVIWIANEIREEHRQALEWLNQKTDKDTRFFGIVIEVFKIDESKPAYNFKLVVFPNEWKKGQKSIAQVSVKGEKYKRFFQELIDKLRKEHQFTDAKAAQPQSWYAFSAGFSGISFNAVFVRKGHVRVEVYIGRKDTNENKRIFDDLESNKADIEQALGTQLEWERLDDGIASRITVYREGSIESPEDELTEIRSWMIDNLLEFKKVFRPRLKACVERMTSNRRRLN